MDSATPPPPLVPEGPLAAGTWPRLSSGSCRCRPGPLGAALTRLAATVLPLVALGAALLPLAACDKSLCSAGAFRCSQVGQSARDACAKDGKSWSPSACQESEVCVGAGECVARVCTPGVYSCEGFVLGGRLGCNPDGTATVDAACGEGEICAVADGVAECQQARCTPGERICGRLNTGERALCGEDGRSWVREDCSGDEVCDAGAGAACGKCVAGALRCEAAAGRERSQCQSDGSWAGAACDEGQVCTGDDAQCQALVCVAGSTRCEGLAGAARSRCQSDGSAWQDDPCGEGEICTGSDAHCESAACEPGAARCERPGTAERIGCGDDGQWAAVACAEGEVCTGDDAHCQALVCTPGSRRCEGEGSRERSRCSDDGLAWLADEPCPEGETCSGQQATCSGQGCTPGAMRCEGVGQPERSRCADDATSWVSDPCASGEVCQASDGSCVAPVCAAGSYRCEGSGTQERSRCGDDRLSWVRDDCPYGVACRPGDGSCGNQVCTPGERRCSVDLSAVEECKADGSGYTSQACGSGKLCSGGSCVVTDFSPGTVAAAGNGTRLPAGRYNMVVFEVDATSGDSQVNFPASLAGNVSGFAPHAAAGAGGADRPMDRLPDWPGRRRHRCGSLDLLDQLRRDLGARPLLCAPRPLARPMLPLPDYNVGDQRTFNYPRGGSVTPRKAVLVSKGTRARIWEDRTDRPAFGVISQSHADSLRNRLDGNVIPRNEAIFGALPDLNGDRAVDILVTNLLPTGTASAFITPCTLLPASMCGYTADHGAVVYTEPPTADLSPEIIAGGLAHELEHLIYHWTRLAPYAPNFYLPAGFFDDDAYIGEGIAQLATSQSGEFVEDLGPAYLTYPQTGMDTLLLTNYVSNAERHGAGYGLGLLYVHFLFDQAGGYEITGRGAQVRDRGGRAIVDQITKSNRGTGRLRAIDGRTWDAVLSDLYAAIMVGALSAAGKTVTAPATQRFAAVVHDSDNGGWRNVLFRVPYGGEQFLKFTPWASRPAKLWHGGAAYLDVTIGSGGATLGLSPGSFRVWVVRWCDGGVCQ